MFDRETIDWVWTKLRSQWPLLVRLGTLVLLLRLDILLPSTNWLQSRDRVPLALVTRFAIVAVALLVMVAAFLARSRIKSRSWLVSATALVALTLVVWFMYARHLDQNTMEYSGQTFVLGQKLTNLAKSLREPEDFENHDKNRIKEALEDPLVMSSDPNLPAEDQLNIPPALVFSSDQSQGISRIYRPRSIDAMTTRLEWGYVALASLLAICVTTLVELSCSFAPSAILPPLAGPGGVFISYRRDDSGFATDLIRRELALRIDPEKIFVDQFSIGAGGLVDETIGRFIAGCDVFVEVIGRSWLSITNESGRRLDDPDDFVRREIEQAVRVKVPILPVLVDGASLPKVRELPHSIIKLVERNAVPVRRGLDFNSDMRRLAEAIASCVKVRSKSSSAETASQATQERNS